MYIEKSIDVLKYIKPICLVLLTVLVIILINRLLKKLDKQIIKEKIKLFNNKYKVVLISQITLIIGIFLCEIYNNDNKAYLIKEEEKIEIKEGIQYSYNIYDEDKGELEETIIVNQINKKGVTIEKNGENETYAYGEGYDYLKRYSLGSISIIRPWGHIKFTRKFNFYVIYTLILGVICIVTDFFIICIMKNKTSNKKNEKSSWYNINKKIYI